MPLFQINYKYVHANGKVRSGATTTNAKDSKEAIQKATEELKAEHDHFEITSTKQWKS